MAGLVESVPALELHRERRNLVLGAAALPGVAWLLSTALWLAGVAAGSDPLFPARGDITLSEAAVLGDVLRIEHLIAEGANVNAASVVREGWLDDRLHLLTPLAAALAAGNEGIVTLLQALGAESATSPPAD